MISFTKSYELCYMLYCETCMFRDLFNHYPYTERHCLPSIFIYNASQSNVMGWNGNPIMDDLSSKAKLEKKCIL